MALTKVKAAGIDELAVTQSKLATDAVGLDQLAAGTDGKIITYDASGDPVAVGPGDDGQVLTSTGAGSPPAFEDAVSEGTQVKSTGESGGTKFLREDGDGTSSWQSVPAGGAALTGSTNNTITTVTSANNIQGEANLTFDGTTLDVAGDIRASSTAFDPDDGAFDAANYPLVVQNPHDVNDDSTGIGLCVTTATDKIGAAIHHVRTGGGSQGDMRFLVSSDGNSITERLRIHSSGDVEVKTGSLIIGTAGEGIDFAATSDGQTSPSERLEDYESGKWTIAATSESGTVSLHSSNGNEGAYVKIGKLVHVSIRVNISAVSGQSGYLRLSLPFATSNTGPDQSWASIFPMFTSNVNLPANTVSTMGEPWQNTAYVTFMAQYDDGLWAAINTNLLDAGGSEYISFTTTYMTDS